jgi:hypothetical protein
MAMQRNQCSTNAAPARGRLNARMVIGPDKVALISPPLEQLGPLLPYTEFVIDGRGEEHTRHPALADDGEPCACSAFPAGLAPRFQAALKAAGYRVDVSEPRSPALYHRVDREYYLQSTGDERALLRAVRAHPLGQLHSRNIDRSIEDLSRLFPDAQILIIAERHGIADGLYDDLQRVLGSAVGSTACYDERVGARCLVSTLSWFEKLKRGEWDIVLLLVFDPAKTASEATRRTVLGTRASRVYAFVSGERRLQTRTRVRLEALSGPVIWSATPPAWSRRRRIRT